MKRITAILGASPTPKRYAFKAKVMLERHGHATALVNPKYSDIQGQRCFPGLGDIGAVIDTVTVYVSPALIGPLVDEIIASRPRRVIFNPGSESPPAAARLRAVGIEVVEACTLVMLSTGQY